MINELGLRSVMDITQDSGSCDGGSIPSGDIRNLNLKKELGFCPGSFFITCHLLI